MNVHIQPGISRNEDLCQAPTVPDADDKFIERANEYRALINASNDVSLNDIVANKIFDMAYKVKDKMGKPSTGDGQKVLAELIIAEGGSDKVEFDDLIVRDFIVKLVDSFRPR